LCFSEGLVFIFELVEFLHQFGGFVFNKARNDFGRKLLLVDLFLFKYFGYLEDFVAKVLVLTLKALQVTQTIVQHFFSVLQVENELTTLQIYIADVSFEVQNLLVGPFKICLNAVNFGNVGLFLGRFQFNSYSCLMQLVLELSDLCVHLVVFFLKHLEVSLERLLLVVFKLHVNVVLGCEFLLEDVYLLLVVLAGVNGHFGFLLGC